MRRIPFFNVSSNGNKFIVFDYKEQYNLTPMSSLVSFSNDIAKGYDQILLSSDSKIAHTKMTVINNDGSIAENCGNGLRALTLLICRNKIGNGFHCKNKQIFIESKSSVFACNMDNNQIISVNMGRAQFCYDQYTKINTNDIPKISDQIEDPILVNVGNPHVIYIMDSPASINKMDEMTKISKDKLFPNGINVHCIFVESMKEVMIYTCERGAGITMSCGSGACAAAIAAYKKKYINNTAVIKALGGTSLIKIDRNENIIISGTSIVHNHGYININL